MSPIACWTRLVLLACLLAVLAGCAGNPSARQRDESLYLYASAIRWSDFEGAMGFIDPEVLAKKPPSGVELARLAQLQVTGYHVQRSTQVSEDRLEQVVEIRVVNRNTQVERSVADRQQWRWDKDAKRWWLTSGLPDLAPR